MIVTLKNCQCGMKELNWKPLTHSCQFFAPITQYTGRYTINSCMLNFENCVMTSLSGSITIRHLDSNSEPLSSISLAKVEFIQPCLQSTYRPPTLLSLFEKNLSVIQLFSPDRSRGTSVELPIETLLIVV